MSLLKAQICLIVALFILTTNLSAKDYYLLVDHSPEVLDTIDNFAKIHYKNSRTWVYTLKIPYEELNSLQKKQIRKIRMSEIVQYSPKLRNFDEPKLWVEDLIENLSQESYYEAVESIVMVGRRDIWSLNVGQDLGNYLAQQWIKSKFSEIGYTPKMHCYDSGKFNDQCNIVVEKKGKTNPDEIVLVQGHMDALYHVNAGADDNASGAAGVIELARVMRNFDNDKTIIFMTTNGEERNLKGAYAFIRKLKEENRLENVVMTVNMDMIGYNSTGKMNIETDDEFKELADWAGRQAKIYTSLKPHISTPAWGSDHVPYARKGIPSLLLIEDWSKHSPCYHKSCDKIDTLNFPYAIEILKLNLAIISQRSKNI